MVDFMTENEMILRYHKGERAVDLCIEKWQRIVDWYKQHLVCLPDYVAIGTSSCALCYETLILGVRASCKGCPLQIVGERCTDWDSQFHAFKRYNDGFGSPKEAQLQAELMLECCIRAKEWVDRHEEEYYAL